MSREAKFTRGSTMRHVVVMTATSAAGLMSLFVVDLFNLSEPEADLLAVAVAVHVDPSLGPSIARAQGLPHRLAPTELVVKRLFAHPIQPIWRPTSVAVTLFVIDQPRSGLVASYPS